MYKYMYILIFLLKETVATGKKPPQSVETFSLICEYNFDFDYLIIVAATVVSKFQ